nr:hypothetical protein [Tanacetum cinerariifolium]
MGDVLLQQGVGMVLQGFGGNRGWEDVQYCLKRTGGGDGVAGFWREQGLGRCTVLFKTYRFVLFLSYLFPAHNEHKTYKYIVFWNQSNTSGDESSRSRNECNEKSTFGDDTHIRPFYDIKPMVEVDNNITPDSSDICNNEFKDDQNAVNHEDECVVLVGLITNLKLDTDENKKIQKQLRNANTSLAQELNECKSTLEETNRTLRESNRTQDRCFVALHDEEDHTIENDILERKLIEIQAALAQKEHDIKEGLKLKAYKILVVKQKHDELVKRRFLTKSHYEGLVKEKTMVITDLKLKEEKDIDKMISMEKPTFSNPMYLKKAPSKKPCLYEIPYDTSDLANKFIPDREETLTLEKKSRLKLNKDLVKPYDYTKQNSLYENFKPASQKYHDQLAHANE